MLSILGFLAVLAPLVIVHEFGHYLFARIFGVKAEVFSIGFGPRIWSKQMGETEVRVSIIPLGGFVKLLGAEGGEDLKPEDKARSLGVQPPWKRFFIFFGGPLFNFIFAIFVFMVILVLGEDQIASHAGRVVSHSAAEKVGFRSGDDIRKINDKDVRTFEDVRQAINENPNRAMRFELARPNSTAPIHIEVTPSSQEGFSVYGEATHVGEIEGLLPMSRSTEVGISDPASPAAEAGIHTGDKIARLNSRPVKNWEEIEAAYQAAAPGTEMRFAIEKASDNGHTPGSLEFAVVKPAMGAGKSAVGASRSATAKAAMGSAPAANLPATANSAAAANSAVTDTVPVASAAIPNLGQVSGLHSSELFVDKTIAKSPAEAAGIKSGDRIIAIGTNVFESFFDLRDAVQRGGEQDGKLTVRWERAGHLMSANITPTATNGRDPLLKKVTQYTIGVVPLLVWAEPTMFQERVWNPFMLVFKATERMVVFSYRNLVSIGKMFTGDVSLAALGGPILIGKIAGESLSRGLNAFLSTMAIISVGLGVLNVLPIPVLDGGHLLLLGVEIVRGRPLTLRQTEIIQQVGLSLILLLMVIVIRNDLARLPFFE